MATVPSAALALAKYFIKRPPDDQLRVAIANNVYARIWNAANFVWTLGSVEVSLTPTAPNTAQQNYSFTKLTDCARFVRGYISSPTSGTAAIRTDAVNEVIPVAYIPSTDVTGLAQTFQWIPGGGTDTIRLDARALYPNNTKFYGVYKKSLTPFTAKTIEETATFLIPDEFYYVFEEGVLWKYLRYIGDQSAGGVTIQEGKAVYSGQFGVFMDAIQEMKMKLPEIYLDMRGMNERKD